MPTQHKQYSHLSMLKSTSEMRSVVCELWTCASSLPVPPSLLKMLVSTCHIEGFFRRFARTFAIVSIIYHLTSSYVALFVSKLNK